MARDALCRSGRTPCAGSARRWRPHAEELKALLTAEQGKPLAAALAEIHAAAWWIGAVADRELPETVSDDMPGQRAITRHVPLGVVGAIVPWNFPVLLAIWKIGSALLTGNTMVLKPSPFTPLTTLAAGGTPARCAAGRRAQRGQRRGRAGAVDVGASRHRQDLLHRLDRHRRKVMASAAANLKRLTLELGGNDAAIVLPDADVAEIAEPLFWAAFTNSGQVCVATKRLYVHETLYDEVVAAFQAIAARNQCRRWCAAGQPDRPGAEPRAIRAGERPDPRFPRGGP